jgi:hypothetical protein
MTDYDDAEFAQQDLSFSSYAYLIDSVRILGTIISIDIMDPLQLRAIDNADARLVNWKLHLPHHKKDVVSRTGVVDEVLLRAHMVISA